MNIYIWGMLVLLKFCWHAHIVSFFSQKVLVPFTWTYPSRIMSFLLCGRAVCACSSGKREKFSKTSTPQVANANSSFLSAWFFFSRSSCISSNYCRTSVSLLCTSSCSFNYDSLVKFLPHIKHWKSLTWRAVFSPCVRACIFSLLFSANFSVTQMALKKFFCVCMNV